MIISQKEKTKIQMRLDEDPPRNPLSTDLRSSMRGSSVDPFSLLSLVLTKFFQLSSFFIKKSS